METYQIVAGIFLIFVISAITFIVVLTASDDPWDVIYGIRDFFTFKKRDP